MTMASLFPIFVKLENRRVLLVGAGRIAEQKVQGLLEADAKVIVVAEKASHTFTQLAIEGGVELQLRRFEVADLTGSVLVIAATGDPVVNQQIFDRASERGILCNAVDEPERCHFYYPAVVRRGDLQIAISTNGKSPALAQRIRTELEQRFDQSYGAWLEWLGTVREWLFQHDIEPERRRRLLHSIAAQNSYEGFQRLHSAENQEVLHG
jgi:precorrin-2 dehydrogenase / sirohydrochlorin ferrochelatase